VIGGAKGAAAKLGLKRTTLIFKMKKLGIERPMGRIHVPEVAVTGQSESSGRTVVN
jgi:hypothetical protein